MKKISCRYKKNDRVYIHCDGTLHRCCHIPADMYKPTNQYTQETKLLLKEFDVDNSHNLLNKPAGSIVDVFNQSELFSELENLWPSGDPVVCSQVCGFNVSGSNRDENNFTD